MHTLTLASVVLNTPYATATTQPTPNMSNSLPRRIDVHSHFLPPFYRDALASNGHSHPDGMPAIPQWSIASHLEMMSINNVSKSIISVSSPGTNLNSKDPLLTRTLTRDCNAYAANLKQQDPDKFGFWAALPLPDVDAALEEIDVAVKEGADGFGFMTNYHGVYLGDSAFDPVFEKLNNIGATIFIHPTTPCIQSTIYNTTSEMKATPFGSQYPVPIFEFFFDTARVVMNLFSSGTTDRCPNMRFIVPHSGGALPPILTRFIQFSSVVPGGRVLDATTVRKQLEEQFYFDLAGFVFDGDTGGNGQLKAFVEGFDISYRRLLYGSDFPFTQTKFVKTFADRMKDGLEALFNEEKREAVYVGNAERLLAEKRSKLRT